MPAAELPHRADCGLWSGAFVVAWVFAGADKARDDELPVPGYHRRLRWILDYLKSIQ